jgi:Outer membrane protein beta-barrel domain
MRNPTAVLITFGSFLIIGNASAQLISIGVKGGVPITDPQRFNDESRRYLVGPSIEFRLPLHFAVELDALYSRVGWSFSYSYTDAVSGNTTLVSNRQRGNSWEFPLLGKYYFGRRESLIQPFLGTGYSIRQIWVHDDTRLSVLSPNPIPSVSVSGFDSSSPLDVGAVAAAGARIKAGRLSVLPEFRYTRWGSGNPTLRQNDVKFLLGVSF